jgi:nicotinamide mononucleotide (NMN) deamidase PncC
MSAIPEELEKRAEAVVKLALARGATLATVESCTAGSFAHLLSQAEGAGAVLHGGFIVYTKEKKTAAIGVPDELLAAHTAGVGKSRRRWLQAARTLSGRPRRGHYGCRRPRT